MSENQVYERLSKELKDKFDRFSETQLQDVYKKFQSLSNLLYRISELKIDLEKLKNSSSKSTRTESLIYLIFSVIVISSLIYFDKIEYTIFVMFIYFSQELDKKSKKNKDEILISQKEDEIRRLTIDCLNHHLEESEVNHLSTEIVKLQRYINPTEYFYKEINTLILHKITEDKSVKEDLNYLISVDDYFKK